MLKLPHNCTHLTTSKVMLKIVQARLQQYVSCETSDVQAGFRKGRGQRSNWQYLLDHQKSKKVPEKTSSFALLNKPNPLTVWITINCGKFWKRWEYQTTWPASEKSVCGQEATVRTGHRTTDWFQTGKGVRQGYILSPCLFNLYVEYIMQNAKLGEVQDGIKIAGRNINNLRYADDSILMEESEELKGLLMKVKEES